MTEKYDVIIVGAGAAGMMSAIEAGKRGRKVLLIDHAQKIGEKIDSSGLKALLAVLLLVVGIAIAYDSFFAEEIQKETFKVLNTDLNFFSLFIKQFSEEMPFFYGLFSIMFAVFLGVAAAFIRRFVSNFKKKILLKS